MPIPAEPAPRKRKRWSFSFSPLIRSRVDEARHGDAARPLDVVVVAADLVLVLREQPEGVGALPVLEVDAAPREDVLHGLHELVDQRVELLGRRAGLAKAEVQRVVEEGMVVGPAVEMHRQESLGRDRRARRVELQLADGDAHPVGAEIAEAEDALAAGHADEPDVALRPVPEDVAHVALTSVARVVRVHGRFLSPPRGGKTRTPERRENLARHAPGMDEERRHGSGAARKVVRRMKEGLISVRAYAVSATVQPRTVEALFARGRGAGALDEDDRGRALRADGVGHRARLRGPRLHRRRPAGVRARDRRPSSRGSARNRTRRSRRRSRWRSSRGRRRR